jgi:alpha-amylase
MAKRYTATMRRAWIRAWFALSALLFAAWMPGRAGAQAAAPWWQDARGPAYQLLVYSYADSDGDGWGDLRGLREALGYLDTELGVSALWLSPIHPASSYHGYDVVDYRGIDPRLGTMADFEALAADAHGRGIKIILDMVFNHSSRAHPWFLDALRGASSPYAAYYKLKQEGVRYGSGGLGRFYRAARPDGSSLEYFSAFWEGMPDLNLDNTDVVNELKGILSFWLGKGADGFRFDAAKHAFDPNEMPSGTATLALNRAFWNDLRRHARRIKPDVYFIGEVLSENVGEVAAYAGVFDGLFDFPAAKLILDATGRGSPGSLLNAYAANYAQYGRVPGFQPAPLLSNHDQDRVMSVLLARLGLDAVAGIGGLGAGAGTGAAAAGGQAAGAPASATEAALKQARLLALSRAKQAASIAHTLPGLPFIYYGEELGMTGRRYKNDDVARRDAFPWRRVPGPPTTSWMKAGGKIEPGQNADTASLEAQREDDASLFAHYRALSALRAQSPALRSGSFSRLDWPGFEGGYLVAWLREAQEQTALVLHNMDSLDFSAAVPPGLALRLLWRSGSLSAPRASIGAASGAGVDTGIGARVQAGAELRLGPGESAVYALER